MIDEVSSKFELESTLLRIISANSNDFFVVIYNGTREIMWMNKRALEMFEYTDEEEFRERYFYTLRREKPSKEYLKKINDTINETGEWEEEAELMTKSGRVFRGQITMHGFTYHEKELLLVRISDIEKLKSSETALRQLNNELEQRVREKTYSLEKTIEQLERQVRISNNAKDELMRVTHFQKAIWDNAGALIVVTDSKGTIEHFNHVAEEKLGYTEAELVNKQTPAIFHDTEEVFLRAKKLSEELGVTIKPGFDTFTAKAKRNIPNYEEWIHITKDGRKFPVKLSVSAIRDSRNNITGYIGVSLDISDEWKLAEELLKNLDRERELNKLKSIFVSTASHEFRTPLAGIMSSATLLEKYTLTEDQEKREVHLRRIKQSVKNLTSILEEFLSLSKIEEGKTGAKMEMFDLKELQERLCLEMKNVSKPGQTISPTYVGQQQVVSDPVFIRHIITNLTTNSIKYSPEKSPIEISIEVKDKEMTISIKDYGIGISKEDQKHLFERFFRATNVAGTQGTGLGLYITKRYVEMLKGTIKIKSEPEKGTEILVTLPAGQEL